MHAEENSECNSHSRAASQTLAENYAGLDLE